LLCILAMNADSGRRAIVVGFLADILDVKLVRYPLI